jgi:hypothetical protein
MPNTFVQRIFASAATEVSTKHFDDYIPQHHMVAVDEEGPSPEDIIKEKNSDAYKENV